MNSVTWFKLLTASSIHRLSRSPCDNANIYFDIAHIRIIAITRAKAAAYALSDAKSVETLKLYTNSSE
uniref:Uncharacterized protein n=1 Tax=Hyaloperonospora arabidopsidis (strain Emoy2) TaxID=559515 RepID=M4BKL2_HYAAE